MMSLSMSLPDWNAEDKGRVLLAGCGCRNLNKLSTGSNLFHSAARTSWMQLPAGSFFF
jgi:hypothetical protein